MATRDEVIEHLTALTSRDLQELQRTVEARWGVSPVVTVDGGGLGFPSNPPSLWTQPSDEVALRFTAFGPDRIAVLRTVRELFALELQPARDLVEGITPRAWPRVRRADVAVTVARLQDVGVECEIIET